MNKNKMYSLFSSSSGNSTLITDGDTNLLVDAGVSASRIVKALEQINFDICEIDGIVVTHEHSDHIKGIASLIKKYNIPIYANKETMDCIIGSLGILPEKCINVIQKDKVFEVRSIAVKPFEIPHDAISPMGYTFLTDGGYMSIATDIGHITKAILNNLSKSETVLIESNHDVNMLKQGKYPYMLKKRILSDNGHLSNENAAWLATQLAIWGTKKIMLGHLSECNNIPQIAFNTSKKLMTDNNIKVGEDVILKVASKSQITQI